MRKPLWKRLPVGERAGTELDWRGGNCVPVIAPMPTNPSVLMNHGAIDKRQRTYQNGGEFRNFLFSKLGVLSLDLNAWNQVLASEDVEFVELIDRDLNECWRIRKPTAIECGYEYDAGIGPRWGVPTGYWWRTKGPFEPVR